MRSIFVTSAVVVAGTLLTLVQALGAEDIFQPVLPSNPIPATFPSQEKPFRDSGAHQAHPSFDLNALKWNAAIGESANSPQHRRSYEAPLFLGKRNSHDSSATHQRLRRSADFQNDDDIGVTDENDKRGFDVPQFLGKRGYSIPNFIGKRYGIHQLLGKRKFDIPQFLGKRGYGVPQFVGRRAFGPPQFVGKRGFSAPQFVGKRGYSVPAFVGKRDFDVPSFVGKRGLSQPMFVGRRGYDIPNFVGKRGLDVPAFIGKRKEESFRDLLATLQAYREYRRLMQTDKRFEAPLFVGKRSNSLESESQKDDVNDLNR